VTETIITADKATLRQGDRAYNHYDMKAGTIERIDSYAQPDPLKGQNSSTPIESWTNYWFTFRHDDGSATSLDGSRICTLAYAKSRNWPGA
jgi:hypothetical protein